MNFTNREKQLLLGNAPVLSRITLYAEDGTALQVFNENDYLVDWDYEDFRYVPDQGFIGQFVERLLDGHLMNIPDTLSLEDKEISVEIAVVDNELEEQVYHNYGRFIITKIEKEDTTGSYKFESSDYTKKFNEVYTGGVTFPCTALKLLNSACDQVGVGLDVTNNTQAIEYVVPKDGLQAGNYHFVVNETYYNFTLSENLVEGNLLMLKGDKLILRKVTSDYNIIREELVYSTGTTGTGTLLSDESYDYYELINDDFIVNDNQFTENNTCRDVVRSVAQLSYTWARINENNKLCLDFVKNDNVDSYDEIDTDKYYEATVTGDKVEPINKVLIGMSQVEGENIVKEQDNDLLCVDTIYGETSQETGHGYQLLMNTNVNNDYNWWSSYSTYDKETRTLTRSTTSTSESFIVHTLKNNIIENNTTYTLSCWVKQNGKVNDVEFYVYGPGATGIRSKRYTDIGTSWVKKEWTFTTASDVDYATSTVVRFDNNGTTTSGQEAILYVKDVMLEKGSVAHDYEDYPTSPDNPHDINTVKGDNTLKIIGDNLFNPSKFISKNNVSITNGGEMSSAGMVSTQWTYDNAQYYTHLKQGNYTLSVFFSTIDTNQYSRMRIMKTDNTFLDNTETFTNKTKLVYHLNLNSDTDVGIMFKLDNGVCTFQIIEGTEETDYKPYEEIVKSINLPVENLIYTKNRVGEGITFTYDDVTGETSISGTASNTYAIAGTNDCNIPPGTYTLSLEETRTHGVGFGYYINNVRTAVFIPSGSKSITFTIGSTATKYDIYINQLTAGNQYSGKFKLQLEKGSVANKFVPYYYEENLFDKDNTNELDAYIGTASGQIISLNVGKTIWIPIEASTTYKVSKIKSARFVIATYTTQPAINVSGTNVVYNNDATNLTITSGANDKYLAAWVYNGSVDTLTYQQILDSIQIKEHIKPIELCKIGNYRDYIKKNTGKNLFDKDNITSGKRLYYYQGETILIDDANYCVSDYIVVQPNTNYVVNYTMSAYTRMIYFDNNKNNISPNESNASFTTPNNCAYIRLSVALNNINNAQLEKGSTATDSEPYGKDEWYLKKAISKVTLNGSDGGSGWLKFGGMFYLDGVLNDYKKENGTTCLSNYYKGSNNSSTTQGSYDNGNNTISLRIGDDLNRILIRNDNISTHNDFKTWLGTHNTNLYYVLATPTYEKIAYQPLIDQLNELKDTPLFEGVNHITVDTLNEQPSLDITVTDLEQDSTSYSGKSFEITGHDYDKGGSIYIYDNPLTYTEALRRIAINGAENLFGLTYIPMEVNSIGHPWLTGKEFVKVTNLENQELYFYPFDRKISYTGVLTTDLSAQAKNEVAQKYENRNNVIDKINHTEIVVDKANGTIEALSKTVDDNKEEFTRWESTEYNSLKSTVGEIDRDLNFGDDSIHSRLSSVEQTTTAITNMFQITGGINLIRNSAFLLTDEVWEFTNNGTNPYHTDLGVSYNSTLSGQTVSVAEIKARSIKIKSKSENITNLKIDTKYTFNFYHQQDNNMTTTIKMYSTENNSSKAFNDIVITGQQEFKNYEVSFTPTTYTNYTIEIIVTSTSSVGYAYIYDMMLNAGDKQAWQPASDEIYSTTLQMSRLGLKVYSVGDGTITLLGSDGMSTWETSDGVTLGRLVSMRTEAGDRVKTVTTEALYLTKDIRQENANRWVETIVTISGTPYKVEYIESGGQ